MYLSSEAAAEHVRSPWLVLPSCLVLLLGLAGCNASRSEIEPSTAAAVHVAARPGVSPHGAPVALTSVEGAPAEVAQRFAQETRARAASLDVAVTDRRDAKYLVRSYLDAQPASGGTVVSYVLDVFDARKARVQRVTDAVAVRGGASDGGGDPWAAVDDKALGDLAAKSAADLAAILSNMPEAAAAQHAAAEAPAPQAGGRAAAGTGRVAAALQ